MTGMSRARSLPGIGQSSGVDRGSARIECNERHDGPGQINPRPLGHQATSGDDGLDRVREHIVEGMEGQTLFRRMANRGKIFLFPERRSQVTLHMRKGMQLRCLLRKQQCKGKKQMTGNADHLG